MKIIYIFILNLVFANCVYASFYGSPVVPINPSHDDCMQLGIKYNELMRSVNAELSECMSGPAKIGPPAVNARSCEIDFNKKSAWPECSSLRVQACRLSKDRWHQTSTCRANVSAIEKKSHDIVVNTKVTNNQGTPESKSTEEQLDAITKVASKAGISPLYTKTTYGLFKLQLKELNKLNKTSFNALDVGIKGLSNFGAHEQAMAQYTRDAKSALLRYNNTVASYYLDGPLVHQTIFKPQSELYKKYLEKKKDAERRKRRRERKRREAARERERRNNRTYWPSTTIPDIRSVPSGGGWCL